MPYTEFNFTNLLNEFRFDSVVFLSGNSYPAVTQENPKLEIELSTLPLLGLLESIRKTCPEVPVWFASSVAVFGANCSNPLSEESDCLPLSFYGATKFANEEFLKVYARAFGMRTGILRIFSTYGPGLRRQLVYDLISKIRRNPTEITIFGDGSESRDLSFVSDQARAIAMLATSVIPNGDIFNIGSGQLYSVKEVLERLSELCGANPKVHFQPRRGFDGSSWCADIKKIKSLGFSPEFSLTQGLAITLKEFDQNDKSV